MVAQECNEKQPQRRKYYLKVRILTSTQEIESGVATEVQAPDWKSDDKELILLKAMHKFEYVVPFYF